MKWFIRRLWTNIKINFYLVMAKVFGFIAKCLEWYLRNRHGYTDADIKRMREEYYKEKDKPILL